MKKLIKNIIKRREAPPPSRITVETIEQHREHILAGGRKFKYPVQYARHKLVINAIIISVASVLIAIIIGWWQLYPMQNTTEFMYRVTRALPLPVAYVDGQPVLYSDYLMIYLSEVHYINKIEQVDIKNDSGKRQVEYIKQKSLRNAIADAYAVKVANKMNISVSDEELDSFIKQDRQLSSGEVSEQTHYSVIKDFYNWSPSEYRHIVKSKLIRQRVAYALDKESIKLSDILSAEIKANPTSDLKTLAEKINLNSKIKLIFGTSGWVDKTNEDGGMAAESAKLEKLGTSTVLKSSKGDGYFVVRQLNSSANQVSYDYIKIPLTEFESELKKIESDKKVNLFIPVSIDSSSK